MVSAMAGRAAFPRFPRRTCYRHDLGLSALLLLVLVTIGAPAVTGVEGAPVTVTWCVVGSEELEMCKRILPMLQHNDHLNRTWTCIMQPNSDACVGKVKTKEADLVILDGGAILTAEKEANLVPVIKESIPYHHAYFAVAVVHAGFCSNITSLADLKGKRSCHTGYQKTAGWILPVYNLTKSKIMPIINTNEEPAADAESVHGFFSQTCAPSSKETNPPMLCTGCPEGPCTAESRYSDYPGAFRCLVEGKGDIAFTKHSIPGLYSKGAPFSNDTWTGLKDSNSYELLCSSGECKPVTSYTTCNFGGIPPHAIVVRGDWSAADVNATQMAFMAGGPAIATNLKSNNTQSVIFSSDLTGFEAIPPNTTASQYLGNLVEEIDFVKNMDKQQPTTPLSATGQPSNAIRSARTGGHCFLVTVLIMLVLLFGSNVDLPF